MLSLQTIYSKVPCLPIPSCPENMRRKKKPTASSSRGMEQGISLNGTREKRGEATFAPFAFRSIKWAVGPSRAVKGLTGEAGTPSLHLDGKWSSLGEGKLRFSELICDKTHVLLGATGEFEWTLSFRPFPLNRAGIKFSLLRFLKLARVPFNKQFVPRYMVDQTWCNLIHVKCRKKKKKKLGHLYTC